MRCQQLLVPELPATNGTHVPRFDAALVLQVFPQGVPPAVLSAAVPALDLLLVPTLFPHMPVIGGLPGVGLAADVAPEQGAVARLLSHGVLPP